MVPTTFDLESQMNDSTLHRTNCLLQPQMGTPTSDLTRSQNKVQEIKHGHQSMISKATTPERYHKCLETSKRGQKVSYNLNLIKTQQRQSRCIQRMNGKFQSGNLSKIKILQADGSITTHTSKHNIEQGGIAQTKVKYSQTEDTPPMTEPLLSHLRYLTENPEAKQILTGSYNPPTNLDPYAKNYWRNYTCLKS